MGITGWIHPTRDLRHQGPMLTAMAGRCADAPAGTGVVRLARPAGLVCGATVGFAEGRHPEHPDAGPDLLVAVDGRLTNRDLLHRHLGHLARPSASDADLLAHAYRMWGARLADRIDGSYAIAIWDGRRRQLLLVCDRIGAKAWYYRSDGDGGLLWATSVRALLAHPSVPAAVDADGLNELLTLGPVHTPGHGVFRGVHELPAAHLALVEPGRICTRQYWRWHADRHRHDVEATTEFVRRALADGTLPLRERPTGAVLLSGGIASAAAAAFATPTTTAASRPAAYTLTLSDPRSGQPAAGADVNAAGHTAAHLHLPSRLITPAPGTVIDAGATTARLLDFPGAPTTDAPLFALLRTVAADTATVVTGDGATAVFGGYPWMLHPGVLASDPFPWRRRGLDPVDLLSADARRYLQPAAYAKQRYADAASAIPYADADDPAARAHRRAAYLTLTHYLPTQLRRLHQLANAAGLALQAPFCDPQLARYLFTVPYPVRNLTNTPLGLLRHTVASLLPAGVTWLPSQPPPAAHQLPAWRQSQREQLQALLTDTTQPVQPLLDQARITELLAKPAQMLPRGWHTSIAYLLNVNDWLAQHHITAT